MLLAVKASPPRQVSCAAELFDVTAATKMKISAVRRHQLPSIGIETDIGSLEEFEGFEVDEAMLVPWRHCRDVLKVALQGVQGAAQCAAQALVYAARSLVVIDLCCSLLLLFS